MRADEHAQEQFQAPWRIQDCRPEPGPLGPLSTDRARVRIKRSIRRRLARELQRELGAVISDAFEVCVTLGRSSIPLFGHAGKMRREGRLRNCEVGK
jgi:hypothetical protein